ncbi:MAG: hypothetical protein ACM31G_07215 [Flavobacteriales bacterium]
MKVLNVKVETAHASMWYNDKIRQNFAVTDTDDIYYKVIGMKNKIIFKCDAVVINNE